MSSDMEVMKWRRKRSVLAKKPKNWSPKRRAKNNSN